METSLLRELQGKLPAETSRLLDTPRMARWISPSVLAAKSQQISLVKLTGHSLWPSKRMGRSLWQAVPVHTLVPTSPWPAMRLGERLTSLLATVGKSQPNLAATKQYTAYPSSRTGKLLLTVLSLRVSGATSESLATIRTAR